MVRCLAVAALALVALQSGAAGRKRKGGVPADPPPPLVDISAIRDKIDVFHDGKGHYFATTHWRNYSKDKATRMRFYGDGKRFYRVPVRAGGRHGDDYYFSVLDPRLPRTASFNFRGGKAVFSCGKRRTPLTMLDQAKTAAMLRRAEFREVFWRRMPHALARDENGTYFYVDRLSESDAVTRAPRGLRVFAGPRGRLKLLRMKDVAVDPAGEVFVTPDGRLKLMINHERGRRIDGATWIAGKQRQSLTVIGITGPTWLETRLFIYRELGVYAGRKLHRPCDDW